MFLFEDNNPLTVAGIVDLQGRAPSELETSSSWSQEASQHQNSVPRFAVRLQIRAVELCNQAEN